MNELNEKQAAALEAINNFILYWTSNPTEISRMEAAAYDYILQDHVLTDTEACDDPACWCKEDAA